MPDQSFSVYSFGDYLLDSRRRTLHKNGSPVDISAKNFDLLSVLVQNEGRILSHDELLDTVWSGTFVEQSNLKKGISSLRHILEESPEESLYIKTVPRRGYVFVAPVTVQAEKPAEVQLRQSQTEIIVEETEEIIDDDEGKNVLSPAPQSKVSGSYVFAIVILAGVAAFIFWKYFSSTVDPIKFENVKIEKITNEGNCYGRLSPDNNFVLCMLKDTDGASGIELQQLATGSRRRVATFPNAAIYGSAFSPDGSFIYYTFKDFGDASKDGLYRISVLGGETRRMVPNAGSVTVSPSGKVAFARVVENGVTEIGLMDANGENLRVAASFPANFRVWDFRITPGDRGVICSLRKQVSEVKNTFYAVEVSLIDGSERVVVPERETLIAQTLPMPDNKSYVLCIREPNADIRQIWQYFPETREMKRITNDNTSYRDVTLSKDGKVISAVAEIEQGNIWVADDEKMEFREATTGVQAIDRPFWTRDGRLGYAAVENGAEVIRLSTTDGRSKERITDGKDGYWIQPSLTGDGTGIVLNSHRTGFEQLWRIDLDGKNPRPITRSDSPVFNGRLLSDGTAIYKTQTQQFGWVLMRQAPDGTVSKVETKGIDVWDLSPDEKRMAALMDDADSKQKVIAILEIASGKIEKTLKINPPATMRRLACSRDGKSIYYDRADGSFSELYQIQIETGEQKKITNFKSEYIRWFDWSFDGKKLAVARGRQYADTVMIRPNSTN